MLSQKKMSEHLMSSADDFDIGQPLGEGGFGTVFRAVDRRRGCEVAVKILDKAALTDDVQCRRLAMEIKAHAAAAHPHIVAFHGWFQDEHKVCIVTELCRGGTLYAYWRAHGALRESQAVGILWQVLSAVEHLHRHSIIHRDIKLANLLICDTVNGGGGGARGDLVVKLCDFGFAVRVAHSEDEHFTVCGTPNYISPETLKGEAQGFAVDLWAVGVVFYMLVVGEPPFGNSDVTQTLGAIVEGRYKEPLGLVSPAGLDFLRCIFQLEAWRRPSALEMLRHPLLQPGASPAPTNGGPGASCGSPARIGSNGSLSVQGDAYQAANRTHWQLQSLMQAYGQIQTQTQTQTQAGVAAKGVRSSWSPQGWPALERVSALHSIASSLTGPALSSSASASLLPAAKPGLQPQQLLLQLCDAVHRLNSFYFHTAQREVLSYAASTQCLLYVRALKGGALARLVVHVPSQGVHVGDVSGPMHAALSALHGAFARPARDGRAQSLRYNAGLDPEGYGGLFEPQTCSRSVLLTDLAAARAPALVDSMLRRMASLARGVQARIPKLIVYFPSSSGAGAGVAGLAMKCMVLAHTPMPMFRIQYSDATTLQYCLQSGKMQIHRPHSAARSLLDSVDTLATADFCQGAGMHWQGVLTGQGSVLNELQHIPEVMRTYILSCQQALVHCLGESDKLRNTTKTYPVIVVSSEMKGGGVCGR